MNNRLNQILKGAKTIILLGLFMVLSQNVFAAEIAGVAFNNTYIDHGTKMFLQGTGLKSKFFFKAFAAGFYKGNGNDGDILGNYPKRIEVEYFVNIPGEKLNNYTIECIKENVTLDEFEFLREEIEEMGKYFVDLKSGDRFSLTYIPGVGTKFAHNGQVTGVIKGLDFARALFSVWIGEKPFDAKLKEQVLGKNQAA